MSCKTSSHAVQKIVQQMGGIANIKRSPVYTTFKKVITSPYSRVEATVRNIRAYLAQNTWDFSVEFDEIDNREGMYCIATFDHLDRTLTITPYGLRNHPAKIALIVQAIREEGYQLNYLLFDDSTPVNDLEVGSDLLKQVAVALDLEFVEK